MSALRSAPATFPVQAGRSGPAETRVLPLPPGLNMLYAGSVIDEEPAYGVIGYPLDFTLSPALHNAALTVRHLPGHYDKFRVPPEELAKQIQDFRQPRVGGFNVTMPHKVAIIPLLDALTPLARAVGAVNTVYWEGDQLCGDNTDVAGFQAVMRGHMAKPRECLVLGAGGAGRAVALALHGLRAGAVHVMARDVAAAERLRAELLPDVPGGVVRWGDMATLQPLLPACELVVNTTPVGADGYTSPLPPQALRALPDTAVVNDLIYGWHPSLLLLAARGCSLEAVDGLPMLMEQAAAAFTRFTGQPAPRDEMWQAVAEHNAMRWKLGR